MKRSKDWSVGPTIDWLLREGRLIRDAVALVDALASQLLRAGAPLWRMRLGFFTNHPQLAAWAHIWTRGHPTYIERIPYGVQRTGAYIGSPAQKMVDSGAPVRYRLDELSPSDHPVLHELAAAGGRDYVRRNCRTVANDRIWTPPRLQAPRSLALRYDCSRISGL